MADDPITDILDAASRARPEQRRVLSLQNIAAQVDENTTPGHYSDGPEDSWLSPFTPVLGRFRLEHRRVTNVTGKTADVIRKSITSPAESHYDTTIRGITGRPFVDERPGGVQ